MSRVGKKQIDVPGNVKINISGNTVNVEGPKGKTSCAIHPRMTVEIKDKFVVVTRSAELKLDKSLHGLTRTLIANMIKGVTDGYSKELEINGVGFKAAVQTKVITLNLGFSHPINFAIPDGITIETPKPNQILIKGIDKQLVGQTAANIRNFYPPEPYKGKGIKYTDEYVRRKAGKTVA